MKKLAAAALALALVVQPLVADEFTEVVESALEAYREGNVALARQELDYALGLLRELKADELARFLPEPLPGWRRELDDGDSGVAFAMFGGGTAATATYVRGGDEFTITLLADSPMVSGMAAMFSGLAAMGGSRSLRIQRQQFSVSDGEIQGVVGGRVLVQAGGDAPLEDIQAHLEAMDLPALAAF